MSHEVEHGSDSGDPGVRGTDTSMAVDVGTKLDQATIATHAPEHAQGEEGQAPPEAVGDAEVVQSSGKLASGFDAREAARLRWSKHRAREAATEAMPELGDATDLIVRLPIGRKAILQELEKKAKKGDTGASRELRAWITELPIEDSTDVSVLDQRERQSLMAELLMTLEEDDVEAGLRHIAAAIDRLRAARESTEEGHPRDDGTPARPDVTSL